MATVSYHNIRIGHMLLNKVDSDDSLYVIFRKIYYCEINETEKIKLLDRIMKVIDKYQTPKFEHSIDNINNRLFSIQSLGQVRIFGYIRYVGSLHIYLLLVY